METDHNEMEKEIAILIKKNIDEMYLSVDELRHSLIKEAKFMEGLIKFYDRKWFSKRCKKAYGGDE